MRSRRTGALLTAVSCLLSARVSPADEAQRISTWAAPPFWSGPATRGDGGDAAQAKGQTDGRHALALGPVALPFIALPPCRLVDTRGNGAPLQGGFLPPATVRNYTLTGVCGVPANAQAISLNATAVNPTGPGFLVLYPQGGTFPPVSTLNYLGHDVIVNAAVVPLSGTGGIAVALGVSGGDVLLDTNGYYAVSDVASLDGLVGDVTLAAGSNITITPAGNTLTIAASGGGGVTSVAGTNGISASPSTGAVTVSSNATNGSAPGTIVLRDANSSFDAGNITAFGAFRLPGTNPALTSGVLTINGSVFLHAFGSGNTFVGSPAGNGSMTGTFNTAVGAFAFTSNTTGQNLSAFGNDTLQSNTTGNFNVAFGSGALQLNSTGSNNSAFGVAALQLNSTGSSNSAFGTEALLNNTVFGNSAFGRAALRANTLGLENTALGYIALLVNTTGNRNTAVGSGALQTATIDADNTAVGRHALTANNGGGQNTAVGTDALAANVSGGNNVAVGQLALNATTTGSNNIALGQGAGSNLTSGGNNIYIGAAGNATESNTMRIGTSLSAVFVDGISGQTSAGGVAVFVNGNGRLGTTTSSRRYKEDIVDIARESDVLMHLRPVAFFYKSEFDASRTPQYGLIAEEVAEVAPQLVVFDEDGRPATVRYHFVNAMLLNEVQKSRRLIDELQRRLEALEQKLFRSVEKRPD